MVLLRLMFFISKNSKGYWVGTVWNWTSQCKEIITHKNQECEDATVRIGEIKDPNITAK